MAIQCKDGKLEGVVKANWSTKNEEGDVVKVNGTVDFTGVEVETVVQWAMKTLIIRRQAVERKLSKDEIDTKPNVHASAMGLKVVSREEQIQKLMSFGLPRAAAELAIDNPDKLNQAVKAVA